MSMHKLTIGFEYVDLVLEEQNKNCFYGIFELSSATQLTYDVEFTYLKNMALQMY